VRQQRVRLRRQRQRNRWLLRAGRRRAAALVRVPGAAACGGGGARAPKSQESMHAQPAVCNTHNTHESCRPSLMDLEYTATQVRTRRTVHFVAPALEPCRQLRHVRRNLPRAAKGVETRVSTQARCGERRGMGETTGREGAKDCEGESERARENESEGCGQSSEAYPLPYSPPHTLSSAPYPNTCRPARITTVCPPKAQLPPPPSPAALARRRRRRRGSPRRRRWCGATPM
jgi:hypothetical protein